MNLLYKAIFTEAALSQIAKSGNVWGRNIEYVYNFAFKLPFGFQLRFQQRSKGNMWGRFGGGWMFKLGIDVGSATSWILNLGIMSIRFGRQR